MQIAVCDDEEREMVSTAFCELVEIPVPRGKYSEIRNLYLEYAFDRKQVFLL